MLKVAGSLGFSEHLIVAAQGRSGGVCLFWSVDFLMEVLEFNSVTIAINIHDNVRSWTLVGSMIPYTIKSVLRLGLICWLCLSPLWVLGYGLRILT